MAIPSKGNATTKKVTKARKTTSTKKLAKTKTSFSNAITKGVDGIKPYKGATAQILNTVAAIMDKHDVQSVEKKKIPAYSQVPGKSTIANAYTKFGKDGTMNVEKDTVSITELGKKMAIIDSVDIPMDNASYHEHIKTTKGMNAKQIKFFDLLAVERRMLRQDAAAAMGMKINSTFSNLLTDMKTFEVAGFDKTHVWINEEEMFPFQ